jgi:hypothetical protein
MDSCALVKARPHNERIAPHISAWHIDLVWIYYPSAVLLVALCIGAWLLTLLTVPGNWIVVGLAAGFAWLFPAAAGRGITWTTFAVLIGVALVGELLEFGAWCGRGLKWTPAGGRSGSP